MKPIYSVGVVFDTNEGDTGFVDTFGTHPVSTGLVVSVPDEFMLENQVNHPLADPDLPNYRVEANGDKVCYVFERNNILKVGDRVVTMKLVGDDMSTEGTRIDGISYISPLSILLAIHKDGSAAMMNECSFVTRISDDQVHGLGFKADDYGFVPSVGIVAHTGCDAHGNYPYKTGDIVLHQGIKGQSHLLPDGTVYELLPHCLVLAVIDKSILKGVIDGLD